MKLYHTTKRSVLLSLIAVVTTFQLLSCELHFYPFRYAACNPRIAAAHFVPVDSWMNDDSQEQHTQIGNSVQEIEIVF